MQSDPAVQAFKRPPTGKLPSSEENDRGGERVSRIRSAMEKAGVDYLVAGTPENVRMLTGYWPVVGPSVAVFGKAASWLILPEDEAHLAASSWVDKVRTFKAGSLSSLTSPVEPLSTELRSLGREIGSRIVATDEQEKMVPATYIARWFVPNFDELVARLFPTARIVIRSEAFARLRAVLTASEIATLKQAIAAARSGFEAVADLFEPGISESELAAQISGFLTSPATKCGRAGGQIFCMSGPNSAQASASYQQSTERKIANSEVLLVHCNSYLTGLWTDITRTFFTGRRTTRIRKLTDALLQARDAALEVIRPGIPARRVDSAARRSLHEAGLDEFFPHGLGHGVGFSAINHLAVPRLHPASDQTLEEGMVFNVEPAVYFPGEFGMRHCDMVQVTSHGCELLTDFP